MQGPHYNPENDVYYDYDGDGRVTTEIHWRSEANSAGTGVESPAGYNLYAQTFYQYDPLGNLLLKVDPRGAMTTNSYESLNRVVQMTDRDNAVTRYAYDPLNDLTNRVMPGSNLVYSAGFNLAGQLTNEWNMSGASGTRTNTYAYFASGTPFAGLLQTRRDGRGVVCTNFYDDRLRVTTNAYAGALLEQQLTTVWQYDPRGYVTGIAEQFGSTNTGPATAIARSFDPYGQLGSESVNGGGFAYSDSESFDAAGRRTQLSILNPQSSILFCELSICRHRDFYMSAP